jgi:type IV pilus assembly protein PilV
MRHLVMTQGLRAPRRQRGFSMIEVLIALLLIVIGVLGMVAMQARTIQYTQDSVQRNTAAMLANDLLELIRSNAKAEENYRKAPGSTFPKVDEKDCQSTTLSVDRQLGCWALQASSRLPGVTADLLKDEFHVCHTKTPGGTCGQGTSVEIQLAWKVKPGQCLDASDSSDKSTVCRYRLRAEI